MIQLAPALTLSVSRNPCGSAFPSPMIALIGTLPDQWVSMLC